MNRGDGDPLGSYYREVNAIPIMNPAEEQATLEAIRRDPQATAPRERLIDAHLGFVSHVVRRLSNGPRWEHRLDLLQEGNLALIDLARKYTPAPGQSFRQHLSFRLRGQMILSMLRLSAPLRLSTTHARVVASRNKTERRLTQKLQREPTREELATALGVPRKRLEKVQAFDQRPPITSEAAEHSEQARELDMLHTPSSEPTPEAEAGREELRRIVRRAVARLDPPERQAIFLYFFRGMTMAEAGEWIGVTRQAISLRVKRGIEALREDLQDALAPPG